MINNKIKTLMREVDTHISKKERLKAMTKIDVPLNKEIPFSK